MGAVKIAVHPADVMDVRILARMLAGLLSRSGGFVLVCGVGALTGSALADTPEETYPTLAVGPDIYTNVVIMNKTRADIFFRHSRGLGNAKVKDLDDGTQMRLGYHVEPPKGSRLQTALQAPTLSRIEANPQFQVVEEQFASQYSDVLERIDDRTAAAITVGIIILYLLFSFLCRCICVKTSNPPSPLIWLPILKQIPLFKAAGMSPWWLLTAFLPPVYVVATILWCFKITRARAKNPIFGVMLLFPVTNLLAFLYLALSGDGTEEAKPNRNVISLAPAVRRDAA